MPRLPRIAPGGHIYHVMNRANDERRIFRRPQDFQAFYDALLDAMDRRPTRLLGWCVMGDHWHFLAWPREDGELSSFFGYLALTHATRWQVAHRAVGTGHVYQPRFKNFMIEPDEPLAWVLRYVERNPLRARLVKRAQDWRWSSLHARLHGPAEIRRLLTDPPIDLPRDWVRQVNRPQADAEEEAIARSMQRGRPLGSDAWVRRVARRYGLQSTIRPRGRPLGWRKKK
jgi:putative transposase